jgi:hypothetical protein
LVPRRHVALLPALMRFRRLLRTARSLPIAMRDSVVREIDRVDPQLE